MSSDTDPIVPRGGEADKAAAEVVPTEEAIPLVIPLAVPAGEPPSLPSSVPPSLPASATVPRRPPRPGLVEAVLWCVVFLLTQVTAALATSAAILAGLAVQQESPWQFVEEQLQGLGAARAAGASDASVGPVSVPRPIAEALVYGMLMAQLAAWGLIRVTLRRVIGPDWKEQIGWRRPAAVQVVLVVLALPAFMICAGGLQELLQRLLPQVQLETGDTLRGLFQHSPWVVTLLAAAVGPGVVEEVWCRGFLGRGLIGRYGVVGGVFWTSVLFGLLHVDPAYAVVTAAMGAYLHFVYLVSRSIAVPILLHTLNNAVAVIVTLTQAGPAALGVDGASLPLLTYLVAALVLVAISLVMVKASARNRWLV